MVITEPSWHGFFPINDCFSRVIGAIQDCIIIVGWTTIYMHFSIELFSLIENDFLLRQGLRYYPATTEQPANFFMTKKLNSGS
jgi:hypothetical protein